MSRDLGLVLCADNVKRDVGFLCHCCACCCNALAGIREHGYANAVVTSNYMASVDAERCSGCGACARACPIEAIEAGGPPAVDPVFCLGCGVCALACPSGAMRLRPRASRVLHPEDVFERVILRGLEQGALQNLLFDDPNRLSQAFLRGLVGGFLRLPPVKRALMGDRLRSRFLEATAGRARAAARAGAGGRPDGRTEDSRTEG